MRTFICAIFTVLLVGCGGSKTASIPEAAKEKDLKGDWTITSIDFDGYRDYEVNLFGDVDNRCLLNSNWNFISNNNRGSYDVVQAGCDAGARYFIWLLDESGKFTLKPTDEKFKSATNTGYSLQLKNFSETAMTLTQTLQIDGGIVVMDIFFIKSQMD